jgi:hypothetical protein
LSFAVDMWSSPNHKAFLGITVHLLHKNEPLQLVLDVVEMPMAQTGWNMAKAVEKVWKAFEIAKKVSYSQFQAAENETLTCG